MAPTGLLDIYCRDIAKEKPLSNDEELLLCGLIKQGDNTALSKLVRANLKFAFTVAKKYTGQGLCILDLISAANLGLIEAAKRFDASRNYRFISYAVWWVRQSIILSLAQQSRIVRLPSNFIEEIRKFRKAVEMSTDKKSVEDIAEELNISYQKACSISSLDRHSASLDDPISSEGDDISLVDIIPGNTGEEELLTQSDIKNLIDEALCHLKGPREKVILEQYYGLDQGGPENLCTLSEKLNLSRERIRQIKERALLKLRRSTPFRDKKIFDVR